ncbi:hypothetical protein ACET3X_001966 [Alternaria dauci]|uniref:Uncharacterized protein n=1 Tax=Alternaria dauci TaxID=48095 RepID=A0ABR3UZ54_9PLEO
MSIDSKTNIDDASGASPTTEVTQADKIRNTMALDFVTGPTDAPDNTSKLAVASPSTPPSKSTEQETSSPIMDTPDTAVTTADEPDASGDENMDDDDDVPDEQREFICMNDEHTRCMTGQYTKDLSRKVISDHFGRNKACTRDITDWPLFCRKHYQRATYNKKKWQIRKVQLILRQFDVIEKDFPGTTYDVAFKKSEEARLNAYSRQVAASRGSLAAAKSVQPKEGKHFEAPIDVLRELDQYVGADRSHDQVQKIVDIILQMLEDKETDQVPSIEFLPKLPGKAAAVTPKKTPAKTRAPKSPAKSPKSPSRTSSKGAVKKLPQKA